MNINKIHIGLTTGILVLILLTSFIPILAMPTSGANEYILSLDEIQKQFVFSTPEVVIDGELLRVYSNESDLNRIDYEKPIVPVNLTVLELPFGTKIVNVAVNHSEPETINVTFPLARSLGTIPDNMVNYPPPHVSTLEYENMTEPYPDDWISYHSGGGLTRGNHTTFFVLRVYPVRYYPNESQLRFIREIEVTIQVLYPDEPIIEDHDVYDLLIIAPKRFVRATQPLVCHKNSHGVKTNLITLEEISQSMCGHGRDLAEKIKYAIKEAVETWGITHILLIGGIKGQSFSWHLPVRYSHTVPWDDQEWVEPSFISDLYYADIYDSAGDFSSWDSNSNNVFGEWTSTARDDMDLYPDVYLGRLACRTKSEVKTMVTKIKTYETQEHTCDWFNNLLLVAGDSYNDTSGFNEGELIAEQAIDYMPGFTPVKVYASEQDINRQTVKNAMDPGCGFAYFCGHGSPRGWNTHFPPHGTDWCSGFDNEDMIFLRNGYKLPVAIVGGCHNAQFDVTMANILKGIREDGFRYFSRRAPFGQFWYNEWVPNCWAWWLTSKIHGGSIATIANTGLGTHGIEDFDNNSIADYIEILDGWLELRFLQLHGMEHVDILGENHGETLTGYIHRFLGNDDRMDVKMVQQWVLFGDPSLKMGGYQ